MSTPSIRQALNRKAEPDPKPEEKKSDSSLPEYPTSNRPFTQEQLDTTWQLFAPRYKEEVHLYNTLLNQLKKIDNQIVQISVDNSVQYDQIRSLKPEIIGFLHRELQNEQIDLQIELVKSTFENKVLTEDQKLQSMISRNPYLMKMKGKFNLDFHG